MVGVEYDQHGLMPRGLYPNLGKYGGVYRRPCDVRDSFVSGSVMMVVDVDGEDLTGADQIQDAGQVVCAAALVGAGFDDEVRLEAIEQLLVDPQVQWAFPKLHTEPGVVLASLVTGLVVKAVESVDNVLLSSRSHASLLVAPQSVPLNYVAGCDDHSFAFVCRSQSPKYTRLSLASTPTALRTGEGKHRNHHRAQRYPVYTSNCLDGIWMTLSRIERIFGIQQTGPGRSYQQHECESFPSTDET